KITITTMSAIRKLTAANSGSDSNEYDTFVNSDASERFVNFIGAKSFHNKHGLIFNSEQENLGLPEEFAKLIVQIKWKKLAKHLSNYNAQMVKEYFGLTGEDEDAYQATLDTLTDASLTEIMEGMTEEGTQWNYRKGVNEWSI
ncbi:hypothetical protein A2U01_0042079, partial [Trifolium medium]|nr:hypothetical protein [Trifolium medium]